MRFATIASTFRIPRIRQLPRLAFSFTWCLFGMAVVGVCVEPERLLHRWEYEPDLGTTWLHEGRELPLKLSVERIHSEQGQVRLEEAQYAILHGSKPELAGRDAGLAAIVEQLQTGESNRHIRLALLAAAVRLSDGSEAPALWEIVKDDPPARDVLERALVRWQSPVALEVWRARLNNASAALPETVTALAGLQEVGQPEDLPALVQLLRGDRLPPPAKPLAARAAGAIAKTGLEQLARQLVSTDWQHRHLSAAYLLVNHTSPAAGELLRELIAGSDGQTRLTAYAAIAKNFPKIAREMAPQMLSERDNTLRMEAVQVLNRFDDVESLQAQAVAFADENQSVRITVRRNLEQKAAQPELRTAIDEVVNYQLSGPNYLGTEQALRLAVALHMTEHCPRFVSLLDHPRPEVYRTAAWALQQLVESPQVLDSMLGYTQRVTDQLANAESLPLPRILCQAFLFEAFGRTKYQPAEKMLRVYIPKNGHKMGDLARTSAIWALGHIMQGSEDEEVAKQLAQRLLDASEVDPESDQVKYTAAIAMGMIGAPSSLQQLRRSPESAPGPIGSAVEWAIKQFE